MPSDNPIKTTDLRRFGLKPIPQAGDMSNFRPTDIAQSIWARAQQTGATASGPLPGGGRVEVTPEGVAKFYGTQASISGENISSPDSMAGRMPQLMGPRASVPPGGGDPLGQSLTAQSEVIPPDNSTISPGKQLGPWTNPATNASPFGAPANMPTWLQILASGLGRGSPYAVGAGAMGQIINPQPAQGPGAPTNLPMQRPSYAGPPLGAPPQPPYSPLAGGSANPGNLPLAGTPSGQGGIGQDNRFPTMLTRNPQPPVAVAPPAARPAIDPNMINLGYYRPSVGNARTPTYVPQGQTAAPPIYRGPMTTGGNRPYYG